MVLQVRVYISFPPFRTRPLRFQVPPCDTFQPSLGACPSRRVERVSPEVPSVGHFQQWAYVQCYPPHINRGIFQDASMRPETSWPNDLYAHVGFPDPSTRSGTYPEGHEKACTRTELDKCEQRPFPRDLLPSAPRSPHPLDNYNAASQRNRNETKKNEENKKEERTYRGPADIEPTTREKRHPASEHLPSRRRRPAHTAHLKRIDTEGSPVLGHFNPRRSTVKG
ncbi:uncharacterized protein LAESUDRAFT_811409 [Laetiporus sulphureus 93-53]|uniref:Uncharacterized protein n=1 Tax=Laetiporus sulphureus 93-53 TaxID=1314785 RepID=A0A165F3H8_9APHY|nr:uncharacterized protein LAESUDRAFT_811409 [Laetiporus sulphureus 93-53]KZT08303.1 hypothetical protein LAESUDRAFT_811409 [Laetiporus sulphureus 93-53]